MEDEQVRDALRPRDAMAECAPERPQRDGPAAGDELKVLSNNDMDEPVFGTPALVGSQIYLRSLNAMWAFSAK